MDQDDPCMVIIAAAVLTIRSTKNIFRGFTPGQLFFGRNIILLIEHISHWIFIFQQKQAQIINDNVRENKSIIDYNYQVGDDVMLKNKSYYKYKQKFKGPYKIVQHWTNGTVKLQMGSTINRLNIQRIHPYKPKDTP